MALLRRKDRIVFLIRAVPRTRELKLGVDPFIVVLAYYLSRGLRRAGHG